MWESVSSVDGTSRRERSWTAPPRAQCACSRSHDLKDSGPTISWTNSIYDKYLRITIAITNVCTTLWYISVLLAKIEWKEIALKIRSTPNQELTLKFFAGFILLLFNFIYLKVLFNIFIYYSYISTILGQFLTKISLLNFIYFRFLDFSKFDYDFMNFLLENINISFLLPLCF